MVRFSLTAVLVLTLAGCATQAAQPQAIDDALHGDGQPGARHSDIQPDVVAYPEPKDPLEPVNRAMFAFNDVAYRYVLVPVSRTYLHRVPEPARRGIGNFFDNLKTPIYLVNHLVQLDFPAAGRDVERFGINSTLGILGIRDPAADRYGINADLTGFSDSLARFGAGDGVYLNLPFVGPSDLRSGAGLIVDWLLNPIRFLIDDPITTFGVQSADYLQDSSPRADLYPELRAKSADPYVFFRDLHVEEVRRDVDYP